MQVDARQKLKNLLIKHESYKQFAYEDTTGHLTIGVGRNLRDRGISLTEALFMLDDDIIYFTRKLNLYLPFFENLSDNRQIALIDMCFNIGVQGLMNFEKMLLALSKEDWNTAAIEMLNSKWAAQVSERAQELAEIIKTGEL